MKTSHFGLEFVSEWEGKARVDKASNLVFPYRDCVGVWTIYVGHVVLPGEKFDSGITDEKGLELLSKDIAKVETAIARDIRVNLNQNQFDALVSFGFNCGVGAIATSLTTKLINDKKFEKGADALLLWSKAGGQFNRGLYNRRLSEKKKFLTPVVDQFKPIDFTIRLFEPWEILDLGPHGALGSIQEFPNLPSAFIDAQTMVDFTPHRY
jgi:lysozyme